MQNTLVFFSDFSKATILLKKIIYEKIRFLGGAGRGEGAENTATGHHFACLNTCQNFSEFQEGCLFHYYNGGYPFMFPFIKERTRSYRSAAKSIVKCISRPLIRQRIQLIRQRIYSLRARLVATPGCDTWWPWRELLKLRDDLDLALANYLISFSLYGKLGSYKINDITT